MVLQNETIFLLALDAANGGFVLLDEQRRICFWNTWMEKHSDLERQGVLGRSLESVFSTEDLRFLMPAIDGALKHRLSSVLSHSIHGSPLPLFHEIQAQQRTRIEQSTVIRPLQVQDRRYCMLQINDVTLASNREKYLRQQSRELRQLALEHRENEAQIRAIIDHMSDALIVIDANSTILEFNAAAEFVFGYPSDMIRGHAYDILFEKEHTPLVVSLSDGQGPREFTGVNRWGQRFPAEVSLSRIESDQDDRCVMIIRDLTERKRIKDAMHREKEFAQVTLQSITDAVLTTDAEGRLNFLNAAACELLRIKPHDALNRPLLILLNFDKVPTRNEAEKNLKATLLNGHTGELAENAYIQVAAKGLVAVDTRISPLRDRHGHIIGSVTVLQDVSQERLLQAQLTYQATHDEVTGLINRREFQHRLLELLARTRADSTESVLLYLDLDQFKIVNDTCSHAAGDQLLRQLGQLLTMQIRNTDTLARLGGDEFAVLLPGCSQAVGERISNNLLEAVREFRFCWDGRTFAVGVSIGLVTIDAEWNDAQDLLRAADAACYLAKEGGRSRIIVYSREGETVEQHRSTMLWATRIQEALEHDRFTLMCQPIIPTQLEPGQSLSYEILVRMLDETGALVPPMAFIPAAERYNLINAIDRWVVKHLAETAAANYGAFASLNWLAINLSGHSLTQESFLSFVIDRIGACGFPWKKICFEITETAVIANLKVARRFIEELRSRGCRFALDDFGSGLSSYAYLKHLPVDYLKIDGVFVQGILSDPIDAATVRSISGIGKALGLHTIAEFVEDLEALTVLQDFGVDYAQGYGICKPFPLGDLPKFHPRLQLSALPWL
jgi:diguanylate cyclase (GGDEF)-like protein/PAS domain S-box-containing protein